MQLSDKNVMAILWGVIVTLTVALIILVYIHADRSNYPVRRTVGWVEADNVAWRVLNLSAKVKSQDFKLFHNRSWLDIHAVLKIEDDAGAGKARSARLKELQISQRYILENGKHVALIEISPVFVQRNKAGKSISEVCDIKLREPIENRKLGSNYYRVQIGEKAVDVETYQAQ